MAHFLPSSESTEIGKQCFNPCKGEQDAPKRPPPIGLVSHKVSPGKVGGECFQDRVVKKDEILNRLVSSFPKPLHGEEASHRCQMRD